MKRREFLQRTIAVPLLPYVPAPPSSGLTLMQLDKAAAVAASNPMNNVIQTIIATNKYFETLPFEPQS